MTMVECLLVDTETTGQKTGYQAIEVAWAPVEIGPPCSMGSIAVQRLRPGIPITYGAMAVHHIIPQELEGKPSSSEFCLPGCEYMIAHNVDYDHRALGLPDVKRICTLALARKVWPDADSHTLGALVYRLLPHTEARLRLQGAHGAKVDVRNTMIVLEALLRGVGDVVTWHDLWVASEAARIPATMPFGKHKGTALKDLPKDYINWVLRQGDVDPYLRKALEAR